MDLRLVSKAASTFTISPEIPDDYVGNLYDFFYTSVLHSKDLNKGRFTDIKRTTTPGKWSLAYSVNEENGKPTIRVEITGGKPLTVSLTPLAEGVSEDAMQQAKDDVGLAVNLFEDRVRKNSIFFAWRKGENIQPEHVSNSADKSARFFSETQILLVMVSLALSMVLFYFLGVYFALVVVAVQFVLMYYSSKINARMSDWRITKSDPFIHLLECSLPADGGKGVQSLSKQKLVDLKKEVYAEMASEHKEIDAQKCQQILSKYGINVKAEDFTTREVNAYGLVEETADKFGFPMPEVVVSNTMAPNAAASGPSPSRGVVMMTTGLFVQLQDNEIRSVLGHEFGHLKGRDPLLLFLLTGAEFLFRFYVLFQRFPIIFTTYWFILYYALVLAMIYSFARVLEERADMTSAMVIGQPGTLADALEKIGFQSVLLEHSPAYRAQEWLSLDSHPPIYFRIARLRNLQTPVKIRHQFLDCARAVTQGFIQSLF